METAGAQRCGNDVVDPGEQCDVAGANGAPGSGCSIDCRLIGRCTRSGEDCESAADCAPGEGCCGNDVAEPGEECDDGNRVDGDCCSHLCRKESAGQTGRCDDGSTLCAADSDCPAGVCHRFCQPQSCDAFGPHLKAALVDQLTLADRNGDGRLEAFTTQGWLVDPNSSVDPTKQVVEIAVTEGLEVLYDGLVYPSDCPPATSCFHRMGLTRTRSSSDAYGATSPSRASCSALWRYQEPAAGVPDAPGWQSGKLDGRSSAARQRAFASAGARRGSDAPHPGAAPQQPMFAPGLAATCAIEFNARSSSSLSMPYPQGPLVRETLRVGDDCFTAVLECSPSAKAPTELTCRQVKTPDAATVGRTAGGP